MKALTSKIKEHSLYKRYISLGCTEEQALSAYYKFFNKKQEKNIGLETQWTICFDFLDDSVN